jgi:hypothetical protein
MTWEQYKGLQALNWSKLKLMARSPAHYHWALTQEYPVDTEALMIGRAVHAAVLEPGQFERRHRVWSGGRRAGKAWEEFQALSTGFEILTLKQALAINMLANAVRMDPFAPALISDGNAEVTIETKVSIRRMVAPEQGQAVGMEMVQWPTKARLDYLGPRGIVDLKTCVDASPDGFGRAAWRLEYLGQAAWYVDAVERSTGTAPRFHFIAVEKSAPYAVQVYEVDEDMLEVGRDQYRGLLHRLDECQSANRWPSYVDGPSKLLLPRWALPDDDEDVSDVGLQFGAESEASDGL